MANRWFKSDPLHAGRILTGLLVVSVAAAGGYLYYDEAARDAVWPFTEEATTEIAEPEEQPAETKVARSEPEPTVDAEPEADPEREARREAAGEAIDKQIAEMRERELEPVPAEELESFVTPDQQIEVPTSLAEAEPISPETRADDPEVPRDPGLARVRPEPAEVPDEPPTVTIPELLEAAGEPVAEDQIFYVRSVRPDDERGLWGIIHDGIVSTLGDGVRLDGNGADPGHYQVEIPPGEDQPRPDGYSSFLGQVIHEKTLASYVYNLQAGTMGHNPHLIHPGQELVIVGFTREELIDIHDHFATR